MKKKESIKIIILVIVVAQIVNALIEIPFLHLDGYDWTKFVETVFRTFLVTAIVLISYILNRYKRELSFDDFKKSRNTLLVWCFSLTLIITFLELLTETMFFGKDIVWNKVILGVLGMAIFSTGIVFLFSGSLKRKKKLEI